MDEQGRMRRPKLTGSVAKDATWPPVHGSVGKRLGRPVERASDDQPQQKKARGSVAARQVTSVAEGTAEPPTGSKKLAAQGSDVPLQGPGGSSSSNATTEHVNVSTGGIAVDRARQVAMESRVVTGWLDAKRMKLRRGGTFLQTE